MHHGDVHRFLRLRSKPLQLAQRPRQQQQRGGDDRSRQAALIDGVHQQAGDGHQHKGDGVDAQQRRDALQRAVDLAVAELQPRKPVSTQPRRNSVTCHSAGAAMASRHQRVVGHRRVSSPANSPVYSDR